MITAHAHDRFQVKQQLLKRLNETFSSSGQANLPPVSVEQCDRKHFFQLMDLDCEGWLRDVQFFSSAGEAEMLSQS